MPIDDDNEGWPDDDGEGWKPKDGQEHEDNIFGDYNDDAHAAEIADLQSYIDILEKRADTAHKLITALEDNSAHLREILASQDDLIEIQKAEIEAQADQVVEQQAELDAWKTGKIGMSRKEFYSIIVLLILSGCVSIGISEYSAQKALDELVEAREKLKEHEKPDAKARKD